jgi:predicted RNA binding protein YcfA (HicA-like mRNA interferase family)
MPGKYPPLTPDEVIRILRARGFAYHHATGSHQYYLGTIRGAVRRVTVDGHYREFSDKLIILMIDQSGLSREEFYGSTKEAARKINLTAQVYPVPLA